MKSICWAPWISQLQSSGLPSIFLKAQPWYISGSGISVWHHGFGRRRKKQTFETWWQPDAGKKLLCLVKLNMCCYVSVCRSSGQSVVRFVRLSVGLSVCLSESVLSESVCLPLFPNCSTFLSLQDVARFCNRYPNIELSFEVQDKDDISA